MKVNVNFPKAYGNLVRWELADANNLTSLNDVEEAIENINNKLVIYNGELTIIVNNTQDADRILAWARPIHITLKTLQQWFIDGRITEKEADRRIKYFYVYDEDDHIDPSILTQQDWCCNVIRTAKNKFTDCRLAQEWCHIMNARYMSRRPYTVKLAILNK